MYIFTKSQFRQKLPAAAAGAAALGLCAALAFAGAGAAAAVVLVLCAALAAAGGFLFDFVLNPNGRYTMLGMFQSGSVKGAEDRTALQVSGPSQVWKAYRGEALEWFAQQGREVCAASGGLTLYGVSFPQEGHRYAILCHGYASKPSDLAGSAKRFYEQGFSVLAPFSRGYGKSGGDYYGMGWLERKDVLAWIRTVADGDPEAEIFLLGVSMGGATVMMASGEALPGNVKCIIEDCGYSSVWEEFLFQGKRAVSVLAVPVLEAADLVCRFRAGYGFREASAVRQLKKAAVPMLFIHGEEDVFVPYSMLDVVYTACASKEKEKLSVPGGAHAQAVTADPALYWDTVDAFLEKHFGLPGGQLHWDWSARTAGGLRVDTKI